MHDNAERWQRIKGVFQAALDRDPGQRPAFVAEACGDDGELRSQVEALLAADQEPHSPLEAPAADLAAQLLAGAPEDSAAGGRIGPYRLLREIGRGGMGAIYLAARDDGQYRDEVAVKLIKRGLDSDAIVERFRRERQILASLKHPNIARLLDGGITDDGRPYFVMEHIEGLAIDRYCDDRRLTTTARLELFRTVCAAVHAAHRSLVVHCDLKPGNILVTAEGVPKLLDFGIARLLDPEGAAPAGTLTAIARPMTPEYASPEQIRGQVLTTASDVYALGVVLYELLTDQSPYRLASPSRQEIERAVCEQEPDKPSTVVRRTEDTGRTHDKLGRRLAGDLDNIVLKALAKEPERRYGSAEQLAEDLSRHLEGLPVRARKPTTGYRAAKFLRRHRVGVVATLLVLLSLVTGIAVAVYQARLARSGEITAERTLDLLLELFRGSDPELVSGERPTLRDVLDRGAERMAEALPDEPLARARLLDTLGEVYRQLALHDQAEPMLEEALDIRQRLLEDDHADLAESLHHLGFLRFRQADYEHAEELFLEALEMRRRLFGEKHVDVAESLHRLAFLREEQGHHEDAEALYREALALRRELLGNEHLAVALSLNNLAVLLVLERRYSEAEPLFLEALGIERQLLGEEHVQVATTLGNLGLLERAREDYAAAEAYYRKALAVQREILGEHTEVATTLSNLGVALANLGQSEEAESLLRQSVDMKRKVLGDHPEVATTLVNLAMFLRREDRLGQAEESYREALRIYRDQLGPDHRLVARTMRNLALVLHASNRSEAAERELRTALELQRRQLGNGHPTVARTLEVLGGLLIDRGEPERAEQWLREALAIRQQTGAPPPMKAEAQRLLANCLTALGRFDEAESLLVESHAMLQAALGSESPKTRQLGSHLAELYEARKKARKSTAEGTGPSYQ